MSIVGHGIQAIIFRQQGFWFVLEEYHLICGVHGDFTRGLVNDPPKRLNETTDGMFHIIFIAMGHGLRVYETRRHYTKRNIRVCTGTGFSVALFDTSTGGFPFLFRLADITANLRRLIAEPRLVVLTR